MLRFLIGLLLTGAAVALTSATVDHIESHRVAVAALRYAGGVLAGLATYRVSAGWQWVAFADTLLHELKHALAALVSGGSIDTLHATARAGGHVQGAYRWRTFVSLAPYCVPLVATAVTATIAIAGARHGTLASTVGLGIAFGLHLGSTLGQVRTCAAVGWHGTDFGMAGVPFALLVVGTVNLSLLILAGTYAVGGAGTVESVTRDAGRLVMGFGRVLRHTMGSV